jgi:hypothetical protein
MGEVIQQKISFSQYQMWKACPKRWKLKYVDGIRKSEPSVAAIFGTAMHEALQEYLTTLYTQSVSVADKLNLNKLLMDKIYEQYKQLLIENGNVHFSTNSELSEYYNDGVQILDYFKKNRNSIFPKKNFKLVGIEMPIEILATEKNKNVKIVGFLDVVVHDTQQNKFYIYDFKTSTRGWGKYQKGDLVKISQLVLYKKFFSEQYDCKPENIEIEYLILKRKIDENAEYGSMKKRIQRFSPPSGVIKLKQIGVEIANFINAGFEEDGSYKLDVIHPAIAGFNNSNCKFCEFKDDEINCPKKERL